MKTGISIHKVGGFWVKLESARSKKVEKTIAYCIGVSFGIATECLVLLGYFLDKQ